MKAIQFLGDSLKRLRDFTDDAKQDAGYQLHKVQNGEQADDFKPMPSIGQGVDEVCIWDAIADTPYQSANMRAKAELMTQIVSFIKIESSKRLLPTQRERNNRPIAKMQGLDIRQDLCLTTLRDIRHIA